ncbi:MAG TPA: VTT domain-containing protein [Candidatus Paceibacterota bacterium]|nr:VTT domain-containing protein [Candidatus Paceibacterota bacterium]
MLKKLKLPILIILIFIAIIGLWKVLGLPSEEVLIEKTREYFFKYGLITVFIASILESMLLVGWYLPGGLIIFLGVILSAGNPVLATLSVLCTILGFSIGYTFNYFLGYYGWHKLFIKFGLAGSLEKAKENFQKYGFKAIYASYWQPNLGALISTSAGTLRAPKNKFIFVSTTATIVWSAFWGLCAYFIGEKILSYLGIVFFVIMSLWVLNIIYKHYKDKPAIINSINK